MDSTKKQSEFKIISSSIIICPVCSKKKFKVTQREDSIPHFGNVLETFASCDACGYKTSDILPLDTHEPIEQKIEVKNESDLKLRFIKSKNC